MAILRRWALLAAALALAGCGGGEAPGPAGDGAPGEGPPGDAPPERIVAVAPSLVELLFALGAGDRVVGVGDYAAWPPEVEALPRIGGLYDPRFETIVTLDPDLAVLLPSEAELGDRFGALGIEVLIVPSESLADVEAAIGTLASRLGVPAAGEALGRSFRSALRPRESASPRRVLLSVAREPGKLAAILVAGPGTFLDELLDRAGAVNAFADVALPYPQVGAEEIVERRPQVILELQPRELAAGEAERLAEEWRALPGLPAPDSGCVRVIGGSHTLLPGPRLPRLYREIREAIAGCDPPGAER